MTVNRQTVDLSSYPDLVVIYLGMRVNTVAGIKTALGFGPQIAKSAADAPDADRQGPDPLGVPVHRARPRSRRQIGRAHV